MQPLSLPLAAGGFDPNVLIPLLGIGLPLLIPIVAILTGHQRKMAQMFADQQRAMMEQQRTMAEIESRRLQAPPVPNAASSTELDLLRDRLARIETELAEARQNQNA